MFDYTCSTAKPSCGHCAIIQWLETRQSAGKRLFNKLIALFEFNQVQRNVVPPDLRFLCRFLDMLKLDPWPIRCSSGVYKHLLSFQTMEWGCIEVVREYGNNQHIHWILGLTFINHRLIELREHLFAQNAQWNYGFFSSIFKLHTQSRYPYLKASQMAHHKWYAIRTGDILWWYTYSLFY